MARKDLVKETVAKIKDVGAKPYTGPGVTKTSQKASSRIIAANKQAQGKKK